MNPRLEDFQRLLQSPGGLLDVIAPLVISTCVTVVFAAVLINFVSCRRAEGVKRERKSMVATGTMTLYFVLFYLVIRSRLGEVTVPANGLRIGLAVAGLAAIVFGCIVNVMGRFRLGGNWANQATIYKEQKLVTSGVYGWVRHPLYASLIWMFFGASLVYANWVAFLFNGLVFVPFMVYRAGLEEALLAAEFKDYADYRQRVGMLFWKPGFRQGRRLR